MNTGDKIGLLPGFGWTANVPPWATLLILLAITPVGFIIVGIIGEGRMVPLGKNQFKSFFPGDVFLGLFVAGQIWLAQDITSGSRWFNSREWHASVLLVTLLVAFLLTHMELKQAVYPERAIFSPTKLYHNLFLYGAYGYVAVTATVAEVVGSHWTDMHIIIFTATLVPLGAWAYTLYLDNRGGIEGIRAKAPYAHDERWMPIWHGWMANPK